MQAVDWVEVGLLVEAHPLMLMMLMLMLMILTTTVRQAADWVGGLKVGLLVEALLLSLEPSGSMGGGTVLSGSENCCLEGGGHPSSAGLLWRRAWRWQRMQEETGMEHFTCLEGKLSILHCSRRPWTSLSR